MDKMKQIDRRFDLADRLIDLAVNLCRIAEKLPTSRVGNHVVGQLSIATGQKDLSGK